MQIFASFCKAYLVFSCFVLFSFYSPLARVVGNSELRDHTLENTESEEVFFMLVPNDAAEARYILGEVNLNNITGTIAPDAGYELYLLSDYLEEYDIVIKKENQPLFIRKINTPNISDILHTQVQTSLNAKVVSSLKLKLLIFTLLVFLTVVLFCALIFYRKKLEFQLSLFNVIWLGFCFFMCFVNILYFSKSAEYVFYAFRYL